jgi:PAS domain S-box-containing protein
LTAYTNLISLPIDRQVWDNHEIYAALFHDSGLCIAGLDTRLRVQDANGDFFRQFGREPKRAYGRSFAEFMHPSVRGRLERQFAKLADRGPARFTDHLVVVRPDGSSFTGELTGIAARDEHGRVPGIMVLVRPERSESRIQPLSTRKKVLTPVDARVLEGVAAGISTLDLATKLYLSRGGVEYHVTALLRKLKVTNRPSLVSKAYSMGLFVVDSWPPRVLSEYVQ